MLFEGWILSFKVKIIVEAILHSKTFILYTPKNTTKDNLLTMLTGKKYPYVLILVRYQGILLTLPTFVQFRDVIIYEGKNTSTGQSEKKKKNHRSSQNIFSVHSQNTDNTYFQLCEMLSLVLNYQILVQS